MMQPSPRGSPPASKKQRGLLRGRSHACSPPAKAAEFGENDAASARCGISSGIQRLGPDVRAAVQISTSRSAMARRCGVCGTTSHKATPQWRQRRRRECSSPGRRSYSVPSACAGHPAARAKRFSQAVASAMDEAVLCYAAS